MVMGVVMEVVAVGARVTAAPAHPLTISTVTRVLMEFPCTSVEFSFTTILQSVYYG